MPVMGIAAGIGALIGWGIGATVASETKPCVSRKNDKQIETCARDNVPATEGAQYGAIVAAGLIFFAAGSRVVATSLDNADELSFESGLSESCSLLGGCLSSLSND